MTEVFGLKNKIYIMCLRSIGDLWKTLGMAKSYLDSQSGFSVILSGE